MGSVRAALFNYLFAKHNGGQFLLRIEDTDKARSTKEHGQNIIDSLKWLQLEWDGDYIRQSDRTAIYKEHIEKLIASGAAYISKEEIKKEGDRAEVVRLKNPGRKVTFHDEIRGDITFDTTELGDFIIARSVTEPIYHFTVVVDDYLTGVTHVIRGEDHISNTPRQILIQEAIGAPRPIYAHLPLILAADRSKLSKRKHGEKVSLSHYINEGFLRDAVINYMALLGWNPSSSTTSGDTVKQDQEIFSLKELIALFDLTKIQKAGAIFNEEKLRWFNREYMQKLPPEALSAEIAKILEEKYPAKSVKELLPKILSLILERSSVTSDVRQMIAAGDVDYYFNAPILDTAKINWKTVPPETTKAHLEKIIGILGTLAENATAEIIKAAIWPYAEEVGKGEVLWPTRYALSGRDKSPDPFTLAAILGKIETEKRLGAAIKALS